MKKLLCLASVMAGLGWSADWTRTYSAGTTNEVMYNISPCSDGGYILAGSGNELYHLRFLKIDAGGVPQWGGSGYGTMQWNYIFQIVQTSDGGYAGCGSTGNTDKGTLWRMAVSQLSMSQAKGKGLIDGLVFKLNSSGGKIWGKQISNPLDFLDALSVCQASDGGVVITGWLTDSYGYGDIYVMKFDGTNGNLLWTKAYGGAGGEAGQMIIRTADGGFFLTGSTSSAGAGLSDVVAMKLASDGSLNWAKVIGGAGEDYGYACAQTSDGGYIIVGVTESWGAGGLDMFVIKLTSTGTLSWAKVIGGPNQDDPYSVVETPDGGFAIGGDSYSFRSNNWELAAIKLTSGGTLSWAAVSTGSGDDFGSGIANASDGGLVVCGWTSSFGVPTPYDILVMKLETNGYNCADSTVFPSVISVSPSSASWTPSQPSYTLNVSTGVSIGSWSHTYKHICPPVDVSETAPANPVLSVKPDGRLSLYLPSEQRIALDIYDAGGRLIQSLWDGYLSQGEHAFAPRLETPGIYMAVLRYEEGMQTVKIVR